MSFLNILVVICSILVFGLGLALIKFDVANEFVTFSAPMGFLVAINYACFYLSEKRKHPSEKKPLKGFMMVLSYSLLVGYILAICGSLMMAGIGGSFLPLITGMTFFLALTAQYAYLEEKRKGTPLDDG